MSTILRSSSLALLAGAMLSARAPAQSPRIPRDDTRVRAALDAIKTNQPWLLAQQQSICEIAAPPYHEQARGAEFRRRLRALGYTNVRIDSIGNVIAERPGKSAGPAVVIAGHLDTVFPAGTKVTVKRTGTRMEGPGIGDDCRGLAVVLSVARGFQTAKVQTDAPVYFVGNVGEEGAGNSRGIHYLLETELKGKVGYFISVDGNGIGIVSRAVGSDRYHVTYRGPGGHSFGAFGMPNPIHALGRAIAKIADVQVPPSPKTTFNVGVIAGGTSVNSISATGAMDIDMRSESAEELAKVDTAIQHALRQALDEENARWPQSRVRLTLQIDTIGLRLAGTQSDTAKIVSTAREAAGALGLEIGATGAASTDANVAIAMGLPGITIGGGGAGQGAHSLGEWFDDGPRGWEGPQWAALVVAALAGVSSSQRP